MAQISKGDTFTDGQQVTGARLNQLVDSSTLLVGAITDQPSITANTLEATDSTIVNDGGVLKEATIGDFLNSNLPITTSSITTSAINGIAGADIAVAPAAGQKFDVNGAFESTTSNTTSNATIGGTLTVTGATTLTGGVASGFTVNGLISSASVPTTGNHLTNKTYVDGTSSQSANGWTRLPNGLILQWGTHLTAMSNYAVSTVTFPIPFPNNCFCVQITARAVTATAGGATLETGIKLNGSPTTTNFSVYVNWAGSVPASIYPVWLAIGN